jgi:hypothetical protein
VSIVPAAWPTLICSTSHTRKAADAIVDDEYETIHGHGSTSKRPVLVLFKQNCADTADDGRLDRVTCIMLIGDPAITDAILEPIIHNALRIEFNDERMRKNCQGQELTWAQGFEPSLRNDDGNTKRGRSLPVAATGHERDLEPWPG